MYHFKKIKAVLHALEQAEGADARRAVMRAALTKHYGAWSYPRSAITSIYLLGIFGGGATLEEAIASWQSAAANIIQAPDQQVAA